MDSIEEVNGYKIGPYEDLAGANLSRANLSGANLYGAYLYGANLSRANLYGANLYGANLYGAYLYGAYLYGAILSEANLFRANLYGAILSGADLFRANLYGANLSGADLAGANLSRANLYGANLYGALGNSREIKSCHSYIYSIAWIQSKSGVTTLQIGCKRFSLDEWQQFDDETIKAMDPGTSLAWWKKEKDEVISLVESNPATPHAGE